MFLTVDEAARRLGLPKDDVRRLCRDGKLAASKVGQHWLVEESAVMAAATAASGGAGTTGMAFTPDFGLALRHIRSRDLGEEWVPDILRHEDQLAVEVELLAEVAQRYDSMKFDPAVEVDIPKTPFFFRTAHVLSLPDRIAYHAVVLTFARYIDSALSWRVYSARLDGPRSKFLTKNGIDQWNRWRGRVRREVQRRNTWLIKSDLTAYFDCINHDMLSNEVRNFCPDSQVVARLEAMLEAWSALRGQGLPQGPDASRILGNLYLMPVDQELISSGSNYFRYMDDIRIVGRSKAQVVRGMHLFERECKRRGLIASSGKTKLLSGIAAINADEDDDRARAAHYFTQGDHVRARPLLRHMLKKSMKEDGHIDVRASKFSLLRLFKLRDIFVLRRVLGRLDDLAPIASVLGEYLAPYISRPITVTSLSDYLQDETRIKSPYLVTYLFSAMLEFPDKALPDAWIDSARRILKDRDLPPYVRTVAASLVARGKLPADVAWLRNEIRREHNPLLVRSYAVALARISQLDRHSIAILSTRSDYLRRAVDYLNGKAELPSLVHRDGVVAVAR